ncbi:right-handed parallel beta-helix repeat-containing protein [Thermodesulfobacteriota bacterium]
MKYSKKTSILLLVLCAVLFAGVANAAVWTVCDSGCSSQTIQGGITLASNGDIVLVRAGTYNEAIDFNGLAIEVLGEGCPEETIIDGTNLGSSVVTFDSNETSSSILSGFTIQNGTGTTSGNYTYGGGIKTWRSYPTIKNCTITNNSATHSGGGIYSTDGGPTVTDCTITNNSAPFGAGGIFASASSITVNGDTVVSYNSGGGVALVVSSASYTPTLDGITITKNTAAQGAGLFLRSVISSIGDAGTVVDCIITDNTSTGYGGGIYVRGGWNSDFTIENCSISNNTASDGGGIYCTYAAPNITDCTINDNTITYSLGSGGGVYSYRASPTITGGTISNNTGKAFGGGFAAYFPNYELSPILDGVTIDNNTSSMGGGLYFRTSTNATVTNCNVTNNSTTSNGGAIHVNGAAPVITNSTLADNITSGTGDAIHTYGSAAPVVKNSILWNSSSTVNEIYLSAGTSIDITYSDVKGGYTGTGNINSNPLFVGSGDYHLTDSSTALIDAGTSTGAPADDIDGDSRPLNSGYDMGSDEHYVAP